MIVNNIGKKNGIDARCINLDKEEHIMDKEKSKKVPETIKFKNFVKGIYLERNLDDMTKEVLSPVMWYKGKLGEINNSRIYSIIQDDPNYPTMMIGEIYLSMNRNIVYFDLNSEGIKNGRGTSNREIKKTIDELLFINKDLYEEAMKRKTSFLIFSNEGFLDYEDNDWKKHIKQGIENEFGVYSIKGNVSDFLISINNDKRWVLSEEEMKGIFDTFSTLQKRMIEDVKNYVKGFDNYRLILKQIKDILSKRNETPYSIGVFKPGGLCHK